MGEYPHNARNFLLISQSVAKHYHISHPPPDSHTSLIDSLSDTFINAFSRVRKPDERFIEMAQSIERYEEGLGGVERLVGRSKQRVDGKSLVR
jgi:sorting nexin-4